MSGMPTAGKPSRRQSTRARLETVLEPQVDKPPLPGELPLSMPVGLAAVSEPADVLQSAVYALGDLGIAQQWLRTTTPSLGTSPLQFCQRPGGVSTVRALINSMIDGTEP